MSKKFIHRVLPALCALLTQFACAQSPAVTAPDIFQVMGAAYRLQSFDANGNVSESPVTPALRDRFFFANCYDTKHCYKKGIPTGAVIFKAPSGFQSTANSRFPRVELRAMNDFKNGDIFVNQQAGTAFIVTAPITESIIFAQIHGEKTGGSEMFKLRWQNGQIAAGVKETFGAAEIRYPLAPAAIDDKIDYSLKAVGDASKITVTITLTVNGGAPVSRSFVYLQTNGWADCGLYFKAGNYNQDGSNDGSEAVLAYGRLEVSYQ